MKNELIGSRATHSVNDQGSVHAQREWNSRASLMDEVSPPLSGIAPGNGSYSTSRPGDYITACRETTMSSRRAILRDGVCQLQTDRYATMVSGC